MTNCITISRYLPKSDSSTTVPPSGSHENKESNFRLIHSNYIAWVRAFWRKVQMPNVCPTSSNLYKNVFPSTLLTSCAVYCIQTLSFAIVQCIFRLQCTIPKHSIGLAIIVAYIIITFSVLLILNEQACQRIIFIISCHLSIMDCIYCSVLFEIL